VGKEAEGETDLRRVRIPISGMESTLKFGGGLAYPTSSAPPLLIIIKFETRV